MIRLKECCCGISLKNGTLIILWLLLIVHVLYFSNLFLATSKSEVRVTFINSSLLIWQLIVLITIIYAIVGIETHRPLYMLPFISAYITTIVWKVLCIAAIWIGSIISQEHVVDTIYDYQNLFPLLTREAIKDNVEVILRLATLFLTICFGFDYYFVSVIFNYYKQMEDEDARIFNRDRGTGYEAAPNQPENDGFNDFPPAYGEQPAFHPHKNTDPLPNDAAHPAHNIQYPRRFPVKP